VSNLRQLLNEGKYEELWQRCCGFLDLSLEDFMAIQRRLLLEQLELLKTSELGKIIMRGAMPRTVEEFRQQVPLTSYIDYAPYLLKRKRGILPEKPLQWLHTSGRSGEFTSKWIPITNRQYETLGAILLSTLILASCKKRGDIRIEQNDKYLYALAPAPYFSGLIGDRIDDEGIFVSLPPTDMVGKMEFTERIQYGFELALSEGVDIFGGISSVLVSIGERFSQGSGTIDIKPLLRKPRALNRMVRGWVKSKLAHRPMLPRDIWNLKCVVASGTDTTVFKDKIKEMWGQYPLDAYACTEAGMVATQTWDYQGMTFFPDYVFFEFIPEAESFKSKQDPSYQPATLLLDEVKAGENYEIVITNFHGGALMRYRVGDMIKITSLRNEQLNIDIPQMTFYSRVDDLIDIAGFTRLTERIIWQAIENSGINYVDWTARKELQEKPVLRLYLETGDNGSVDTSQIATSIHNQLKILDSDYANLEAFTGMTPLEVMLVPKTAFQKYMQKQQAAGADLAHLKIPHINPSDKMVDFLMHGPRRVPTTTKTKTRQRETVTP